MRLARPLATFVVLFALALTVVAPAAAARGELGRTVPFHGSVTASDTPDFFASDCAGDAGELPFWRYHSHGTGAFSHLGRVSSYVTHCSYLSEVDGDFPFGAFSIEGYTVGSTSHLTAANGDILILAQEVTFAGSFAPSVPSYSYATGTWVVSEGTGRFLGATGSGTIEAVTDMSTDATTATYTGTIRYDASARSLR
jgi:hypothetical protein